MDKENKKTESSKANADKSKQNKQTEIETDKPKEIIDPWRNILFGNPRRPQEQVNTENQTKSEATDDKDQKTTPRRFSWL